MEFRGEVSDEALRDAYRDCDLLVAPSRFESFGLVFVEAMMAGRPVVALDQGAAPEVVGDDGAGVLVDEDTSALIDALTALIDDPQRRRRLGEAGRHRFMASFTVSAMADAFEDHLRSCSTVRLGDERCRVSPGAARVVLADATVGVDLDAAWVELVGLPAGRTTLVVWLEAEAHDVTVAIDGWTATVRPGTAACFHHLLLPTRVGSPVRVTGGAGATFAAVHVVAGGRGDGLG